MYNVSIVRYKHQPKTTQHLPRCIDILLIHHEYAVTARTTSPFSFESSLNFNFNSKFVVHTDTPCHDTYIPCCVYSIIEFTSSSELSKIEEDTPDSYSLSQDTWNMSDVEISESESETIDDESETAPMRKRKAGKLTKVNEKGETPLHQACVEGKIDKVC